MNLNADTTRPSFLNSTADERWFSTYMSMPRYVDRLLEECGSRRFYARGERGEPHAPTNASEVKIKDWTAGMCEAMAMAMATATEMAPSGRVLRGTPPVTWDALWEHQPSKHPSLWLR